MRLRVSPAAASTPTGVFNQRFEALFPRAGALGCSLFRSPTVPLSLSMHKCGASGSASSSTACPLRSTILQSLGPATLPRVLSTPAARLCCSYRSGRMFLLYLLSCRTSVRFDFLSVLVVFCFSIVVVLLLVVRGGSVCLPIPPSWFLPPCFLAFNFPFSFQLSSTLDRCV